MENFAVYRKNTEYRLSKVIKLDDPLMMTVNGFVSRYGSELSASVKTRICRSLDHIETIQDLLTYSKEDLLRLHNLGKGSVDGLEKILKKFGFQLKD